jgi:hypothetical protein
MSDGDDARSVFSRDAEQYHDFSLQRPERLLLTRVRGRLIRVLDIGVGAG